MTHAPRSSPLLFSSGSLQAAPKPRLLIFTTTAAGYTRSPHQGRWAQHRRQRQQQQQQQRCRHRHQPAVQAVQSELPSLPSLLLCQLSFDDPEQLEAASRQQLHTILGSLQKQGELSPQQVQLACQLSAELDLCRLAPDAVAAALLVLVARAEGRRLPIAVAGRTVSRVCRASSPSYSSVVGQVHELEELWQASPRWQQLLGQAVMPAQLNMQQAQQVLAHVAAHGPPAVGQWAALAARVAASMEPGPGEAAGNLAGGLVLALSRAAGWGQGGSGGRVLSPQAVVDAVKAAGAEASLTGVLSTGRRLEGQLDEVFQAALGQLFACSAPEPVLQQLQLALREQQQEQQGQQGQDDEAASGLPALLAQLVADGALAPADAPLLLRLAGSLPHVSWVAGNMVAALLVVLGWARGEAGPGYGEAAAAVSRGGGEACEVGTFHVRHLVKHWETNSEWQQLLGSPKDGAAVLRERLLRLLGTLSERGDLAPSRLSAALRLAAELPQAVTAAGPHLAGSCGGALLVLLAAAQGERLAVSRAVKVVQAAGAPASAQGINTSLARLREHWKHSAVWRQELGDPPLAAATRRTPVPLLLLLHRLAEAGHLAPEMVPPAERLAASMELPASAQGNFAGALIVLAAAVRQRQRTLHAAAAAVRAVGGSASLGKIGVLLRRLREGWEEGSSECEALLGPYLPGSGFDKQSLSHLHTAIEQLSRTGALPLQQQQLAQQLAADLAGSARKAWQPGNVAAAVLILLAAASGSSQQLLPAQAATVVQNLGLEASATAVSRHRATAWRLWKSNEAWQAALGSCPLPHPVSHTTVVGLLRALERGGVLPSSQLEPALALAQRLKVPREQAGAVAVALAVGWAQASGREPCAEAAAAIIERAGCVVAAAAVQEQRAKLECRFGPPTAWVDALQWSRAELQQHLWRHLAVLLSHLGQSGHLAPGQAAKVLHLASSLAIWSGSSYTQRPGNVAAALLVVASRARGEWVTCRDAVAAVEAAGATACASSVTRWTGKCVRLWRESPEWQAVLGPCPQRPPAMPIPPSRMNPSRLLRALSSKGCLPASELQPLLKLARGLQVPPGHVGAAAVALAVGWAESSGRAACVDALTSAVQELGVRVAAADVWEQRAKLQQRWGQKPRTWGKRPHQPRLAGQQQLAALLSALERAGHLAPGQAAMLQALAASLGVIAGPAAPALRPGNVAGALLVLVARAAGRSMTCSDAVAAVQAAGQGAVATSGSVYRWSVKGMRLWQDSPEWRAALGPCPSNKSTDS